MVWIGFEKRCVLFCEIAVWPHTYKKMSERTFPALFSCNDRMMIHSPEEKKKHNPTITSHIIPEGSNEGTVLQRPQQESKHLTSLKHGLIARQLIAPYLWLISETIGEGEAHWFLFIQHVYICTSAVLCHEPLALLVRGSPHLWAQLESLH